MIGNKPDCTNILRVYLSTIEMIDFVSEFLEERIQGATCMWHL